MSCACVCVRAPSVRTLTAVFQLLIEDDEAARSSSLVSNQRLQLINVTSDLSPSESAECLL